MQYRTFGRLGWQVSALGFGAMRLPPLGSRGQIDEPEAQRMIRYAIDRGVNYVDTGWRYHDGHSEPFLGRALSDGYRDKVYLATKLWWGEIHEPADFDRHLNEQLDRLQTDHLDVYLLHGMREQRWAHLRDMGVLEFAERAKADGRIRTLGFSFHDSLEVFRQVVDAYDDWGMCQIQYNFMNETHQAGTEGLEYAASKGIATVIMEPLLGGRLVSPPAPIQAIWDAAPVKRDPVDWAFSWLWNKPQVSLALSGMSTMQHVKDNLRYADSAAIGALSDDDLAAVAQAQDAYQSLTPVPCTTCGYCMPCPNGVDIPRNFSLLNGGVMYADLNDGRQRYHMMPEEARASACIACGECEIKCPQHIPISDWMPVVDEVLGQGKVFSPDMAP